MTSSCTSKISHPRGSEKTRNPTGRVVSKVHSRPRPIPDGRLHEDVEASRHLPRGDQAAASRRIQQRNQTARCDEHLRCDTGHPASRGGEGGRRIGGRPAPAVALVATSRSIAPGGTQPSFPVPAGIVHTGCRCRIVREQQPRRECCLRDEPEAKSDRRGSTPRPESRERMRRSDIGEFELLNFGAPQRSLTFNHPGRSPGNAHERSLSGRNLVLNLKRGLLWWPLEPTLDPRLHARHESVVTELLPAFP